MKNPPERFFYYDTEIGRIRIAQNETAITEITLGDRLSREPKAERETPLIKMAAEQLKDYLAGNRRAFDLPLDPQGTDFQKSVWKALLLIPYGETRSYKEIAQAVGNQRACRAVGGANNKNPILIVIPCHRVIGSDGRLVGYGGGIDLKQKLLSLEGLEVSKKG